MAKKQNEQSPETQNLENKQQNQPAQEQNLQNNQENQPDPNAQENAENQENSTEQNQNAQEQNLQNQPEQEKEIPDNQSETEQIKSENDLISFQELAAKHRLPTWQSAAILRLLDKEDDVCLSEQEFLQAVEKLYNRKMGN